MFVKEMVERALPKLCASLHRVYPEFAVASNMTYFKQLMLFFLISKDYIYKPVHCFDSLLIPAGFISAVGVDFNGLLTLDIVE